MSALCEWTALLAPCTVCSPAGPSLVGSHWAGSHSPDEGFYQAGIQHQHCLQLSAHTRLQHVRYTVECLHTNQPGWPPISRKARPRVEQPSMHMHDAYACLAGGRHPIKNLVGWTHGVLSWQHATPCQTVPAMLAWECLPGATASAVERGTCGQQRYQWTAAAVRALQWGVAAEPLQAASVPPPLMLVPLLPSLLLRRHLPLPVVPSPLRRPPRAAAPFPS